MKLPLTDSERRALRQVQKQRRDEAGYVKVTVVLMLDSGWPVGGVVEALSLDEATVYRYVRAFTDLRLARYLLDERPGYWGLLSSAQPAGLCHEVTTRRYTNVKAIQGWVAATYGVAYRVSGLTELRHRLGFTHKLTPPVPCQAEADEQQAFLQELTVLEAHVEVERGQAVLYYADAAYPTHNTRCTRAWCAVGQQRPLLTVSGREWVNLGRGWPISPSCRYFYRPTRPTRT